MKQLIKSNSERQHYFDLKKKATKEELKIHPEMSLILNNEKRIKLDLLNNIKSNSISTSHIRDSKQVELIESLNSFKSLFLYYNKIGKKNNLKIAEKHNNKFEKEYKLYKKRRNSDIISENEMYNDIKERYKEKNIQIPKFSTNKNLFNPNLLIIQDNDLKKYIELNLLSNKKNQKSIHYLKKLKKELDLLRKENNGKKNNLMSLFSHKKEKKINPFFEKKKNNISEEKELMKSRKEISKLKSTFNNISNIDHFFQEKNNSISNINNNYKSRNGFEIYSNKLHRSNSISQYENDQVETTTEKLPLIKNVKRRSLINLKKRYINNEEEKSENKVTQFIKLFPSHLYKRLIGNTSDTRKIALRFKSPLEKLYEKVSATDNQLKFNKKIKNYLKNRGLDISDDVSVKEICRQINNSKIKIVDKDLLIKDIELRSQNFDSRETSKEKLEKLKFDNNIKEIMNASQNKMLELFCHFHKDNN